MSTSRPASVQQHESRHSHAYTNIHAENQSALCLKQLSLLLLIHRRDTSNSRPSTLRIDDVVSPAKQSSLRMPGRNGGMENAASMAGRRVTCRGGYPNRPPVRPAGALAGGSTIAEVNNWPRFCGSEPKKKALFLPMACPVWSIIASFVASWLAAIESAAALCPSART